MHRWPMWVGAALVPLGIVAFLYGGPISQVYGVLTLAAGVLLIGMVLYTRSVSGRAVE